MVAVMAVIFIMAYIAISMEHVIKVNKAATALFASMLMWTIYVLASPSIVPTLDQSWFQFFLEENKEMAGRSFIDQARHFVIEFQLLGHVGDVAEIVFFLLGAMTIVELIDVHGGFSIITDKITTRNKRKLLYLLVFISFFMSAVIDNLTTAIVMVTMLNKIIPDKNERWWYGSMIVLAANSGGAWSPIGDVTTILLWVKGTVTPVKLMEYVFLPSVVSVLVPVLIVSRSLHGNLSEMIDNNPKPKTRAHEVDDRKKVTMLIMGIGGLLFVPVYKAVTDLPPFTGIMLVLGALWIITDLMYHRIPYDIPFHLRVGALIKRIDLPTLIFFLGILLAVAALQAAGGLQVFSVFLEEHFSNIYVINLIIGVLSSIVDNVPLVAAALGLYPIVDPATLSTMTDPSFAQYFVPDGIYWHFLTYCAGIGGSLLIIGSAAGVVVMGIERIDFTWYVKKISLLALIGYISGAIVFMLEILLIHGKL